MDPRLGKSSNIWVLPSTNHTNRVAAGQYTGQLDAGTGSVPVFWPHIRQVAAAGRPATRTDISPVTGSPVGWRGLCCPAWAHFSPGRDAQKKKEIPQERKNASVSKSVSTRFPELKESTGKKHEQWKLRLHNAFFPLRLTLTQLLPVDSLWKH